MMSDLFHPYRRRDHATRNTVDELILKHRDGMWTRASVAMTLFELGFSDVEVTRMLGPARVEAHREAA